MSIHHRRKVPVKFSENTKNVTVVLDGIENNDIERITVNSQPGYLTLFFGNETEIEVPYLAVNKLSNDKIDIKLFKEMR